MICRVRDLSVGDKFILNRTGEIFAIQEISFIQNRKKYFVTPSSMRGFRSNLNHQCQVTPIF